jgi:branched-chain amino acid transport system substrate-binding protein
LAQEFIKAYEMDTKREVDAFAALGGDCYFLIMDALERAKTTEGPKLRQALAQTRDFPGVSGSITMGPDNNPIKEVNILKVQGGRFVFVTKMTP